MASSHVTIRARQENTYYMLHPNFISLKSILKDTQGTRHNPNPFAFSKEEEDGGLKDLKKSEVCKHFGIGLSEWELARLIAA